MNPDQKLHLIILRRDGIMFEGDVEAVSSKNDVGPFDILSEHGNFVSTVNEYVRIHKLGGEVEELKIDKGILRVKENKLEIFIGF
jgi:F0F1-type ATP synthase epsilon subunit